MEGDFNMTTFLYYGLEFLIIFIITVMATIIPTISKPGIMFGIEIPFDKKDDGLYKLKTRYQMLCIAGGFVLAAVTLILHLQFSMVIADILLPLFMIAYLLFTIIIYYINHNTIKQIKKEKGWDKDTNKVILADTTRADANLPSYMWFIIHFILILATGLFLLLIYPYLPEFLPMHLDIEGNINNFAPKSLKIILLPVVTQVYITLICIFTFISIKKSKRQLDPKDPVASSKRIRMFKAIWLYYTLALSFLLNVLMAIIAQLMFVTPEYSYILPFILFAMLAIILIGTVIISVKTGQSGSRIKIDGKRADGSIQTGSDKYWKAGMFYYNPNDPSIFIEKRFGVGWTFNYARPASWWITAGLFAVIAGFVAYSILASS